MALTKNEMIWIGGGTLTLILAFTIIFMRSKTTVASKRRTMINDTRTTPAVRAAIEKMDRFEIDYMFGWYQAMLTGSQSTYVLTNREMSAQITKKYGINLG